MDSVPPEIRENIIGHILGPYYGEKLARYATVSRGWQASVEQHIFRNLRITTGDLDTFTAIYNGDSVARRRFLASLGVTFILPSPPSPGCCPVERKLDRDADSASFSASVAKLFSTLSNSKSRIDERHPLSLTFVTAYRMSKFEEPDYNGNVPCDRDEHSREDIKKAVANLGFFKLVKQDSIPSLNGVASLEFMPNEELLYLHHSWIPKLVQRLPGLQQLVLGMEDRYTFGRQRRQANRDAFVKAISIIPSNHIIDMRLKIGHENMLNESVRVQELVKASQWREDAWCYLASRLGYFESLTTLHLRGGLVLCPSLFQTFIACYSGFTRLEDLVVEFAPETADGRWFYKRDDEAFRQSREDPEYEEYWQEMEEEAEDYDDGDDEHGINPVDGFPVFEDGPLMIRVDRKDRFRSLPEETTLLPFLLKAARAVKSIPTLRKFILGLKDKSWPSATALNYPFLSRVLELWYLKAGTPRSPKDGSDSIAAFPIVYCDAKYLNQNRIYWRTAGWTPWEEVYNAWQKVAGPNAKIVFLDEDMWTRENGIDREIYEGEF